MKKACVCVFFLLLLTSTRLTAKSSINLEGLVSIDCKLCPIVPFCKDYRQKYLQKKVCFFSHNSSMDSSFNWSGYAAVTNLANPEPGSVTEVSGSWQVPVLIHSNKIKRRRFSSFWVGIDGFSNNTVEQVGTESDVWINRRGRKRQRNYAWIEVYPKPLQKILNFPVKAGDEITAEVQYTGTNTYTFTIANITQGVFYTTNQQAIAENSSAEWIVEAPFLRQILPLANFGKAFFKNCLVEINGISGSIKNEAWKNQPIIMETKKGVLKAIPSDLFPDGASFSVQWLHH